MKSGLAIAHTLGSGRGWPVKKISLDDFSYETQLFIYDILAKAQIRKQEKEGK